ncbi:Rrf2 family protein [Deinobacterium chartae]|uniref:Rrf2 family protein n=1 Tax=Deinobacterium chartae TaxID=521158 RepID=A0A841I0D0_9DEIO|nr:Rrf2 family transcriptional regulator [Deinobacterium chartae]MBB6098566.1 Rrf2 family protein [Deinobacterium chartae]
MQLGVGVEYALHSMNYLASLPPGVALSLRDLATFQGITETYLAKIFAKLAKAGLVLSTPGVKGGYRLARDPADITFWDVVSAVEGGQYLFRCRNVRAECILLQGGAHPEWRSTGVCTIHAVMMEAEERMRDHLRSKNLVWLRDHLARTLPEAQKQAARAWFVEALSRRG